jgi:hypothetical protein
MGSCMSLVRDADTIQLQQIRRECDTAIRDIRSVEKTVKILRKNQNR